MTPSALVASDVATTPAATSQKPIASTTLYPIRVSCFAKQVARRDGEIVTVHELSISRLFSVDGKPDHRSLTINRTEAMKLLCALHEVYRQSFQADAGEPSEEE